ncbi:hypothetical protein BASA62_008671 [Batrachochytrium salamandrivorans]|nr:hypothetical protein BASA62_008671 [Batrachochytrium salamandrivorans]
MDDAIQALKDARILASKGLYASAQIHASLLISTLSATAHRSRLSATLACETYMLFADCLVAAKEYRRSLIYYENALQALNFPRGPKPMPAMLEFDLRLRYAQACIYVDENYQAKQLLEFIPVEKRTVQCFLHKNRKLMQLFLSFMYTWIRFHPDAVESAIALLDHMIPLSEFESLLELSKTVWQFVRAHASSKRFEFRESFRIYADLETSHKYNITLLLGMLSSALDSDELEVVQPLVSKIKKVDGCVLQHMDRVASMYFYHGNQRALDIMVTECFRISDKLPEPWVVAARYSQLKNNIDMAIAYTSKALILSPRHLAALHTRGDLFHQKGQYQDAIKNFRTAYSISRDIKTYEGLVHCYSMSHCGEEAAFLAKEAVTLMPSCPRALSLVAFTLIDHISQEQGMSYLKRALAIRPTCIEALDVLCRFCERYNLSTCIPDLLEKYVHQPYSAVMYARLGSYYMKIKQYETALDHYNSALRINPDNELAKAGLESAERKIGGDEDEEEGEDIIAASGDLSIEALSDGDGSS